VNAAEQSSIALMTGARLGRYQIMRRIAVGGMAELYLARHVGRAGFEKVVAIKRVLPHLAEDAKFVDMFLDEARLAAGLDHSNIATVIDFGSAGREHFMAMEYVHGRNVRDILKQGGASLPCALTIVKCVAAALHYAHERCGADGLPLGLVHRDVSPSNVLVSYAGDVKLCDFGIAKATTQSSHTRSGTIKGKLSYMAPEQIRAEQIDRRADVFALAVVAYELTTGKRCFFASGEFALINRVAEGRFERPSAVVPGFSPRLERVLLDALAVDPDVRTPTARAFQEAIEEFANDEGIRLSNTVLSDFMQERFTPDAFPATESLPPPTVAITASSPLRMITSTRQRRTGTRWRVVGALAAGLAIGVGAQQIFADDPATPSARADDPVPLPAATTPTQAVAPVVPAPADDDTEETVIIEEDASPAKGASKRPRPRKTSRPAAPPAAPAPAPAKKAEYLPPSRRGE
jgi:serine/threonine protein kinase